MGHTGDDVEEITRKYNENKPVKVQKDRKKVCCGCLHTYDDINQHIKTKQHQDFLANNAFFDKLEQEINGINGKTKPQWIQKYTETCEQNQGSKDHGLMDKLEQDMKQQSIQEHMETKEPTNQSIVIHSNNSTSNDLISQDFNNAIDNNNGNSFLNKLQQDIENINPNGKQQLVQIHVETSKNDDDLNVTKTNNDISMPQNGDNKHDTAMDSVVHNTTTNEDTNPEWLKTRKDMNDILSTPRTGDNRLHDKMEIHRIMEENIDDIDITDIPHKEIKLIKECANINCNNVKTVSGNVNYDMINQDNENSMKVCNDDSQTVIQNMTDGNEIDKRKQSNADITSHVAKEIGNMANEPECMEEVALKKIETNDNADKDKPKIVVSQVMNDISNVIKNKMDVDAIMKEENDYTDVKHVPKGVIHPDSINFDAEEDVTDKNVTNSDAVEPITHDMSPLKPLAWRDTNEINNDGINHNETNDDEKSISECLQVNNNDNDVNNTIVTIETKVKPKRKKRSSKSARKRNAHKTNLDEPPPKKKQRIYVKPLNVTIVNNNSGNGAALFCPKCRTPMNTAMDIVNHISDCNGSKCMLYSDHTNAIHLYFWLKK